MSTFNLSAIRAKLAAEEAAKKQPAGVPVIPASPQPAFATGVALPSTLQPAVQVQAPSTANVMAQMKKLAQNIPADDPKLSAEENYLRQASAMEVQNKIEELSNLLLAQHPTMPVLLQEIHKTLKQQPENVTLLSDEQIGVIVSGLLKHTATAISTKTTTKKTKVSQKLNLSDLGF